MHQKWIGVGRLVADPELQYVGQGIPVSKFSLAIERPFANGDGKREVDYPDCVAWRNDAEFAANYLEKGRLVMVEGWWKSRSYVPQGTNQKRRVWEVQVTALKALDRPKNGDGNGSEGGYEHGDESALEDDPMNG